MIEGVRPSPIDWETELGALLPLFGHRNWIVIADAAYPAQARAGIETIIAPADQLDVVRKVAAAIASSQHVRAMVYLDDELSFVAEKDAPGVENYRRILETVLSESTISCLPHDQIIARLDEAARVFRVLILKTAMLIPYTSVFFELDCGYWNNGAEQRLRKAIEARHARKNQDMRNA